MKEMKEGRRKEEGGGVGRREENWVVIVGEKCDVTKNAALRPVTNHSSISSPFTKAKLHRKFKEPVSMSLRHCPRCPTRRTNL